MKTTTISNLLLVALAIAVITFSLAVRAQAQTEVFLHYFTGNHDGYGPNGKLIFDSAGNIYGTAAGGGNTACSFGCGVVYRLSPTSSGGWHETVLHEFTGGWTGYNPIAGVVRDAAGNLYGSAYSGGITNSNCINQSCGLIYELIPTATGYHEKVLHVFTGKADGGNAYGGVILDAAGNLYGTTVGGPHSGSGTVFELSPTSSGYWNESILYTFTGGNDGGDPLGGLTFDSAGNLYGTTYVDGAFGYGTVYELTKSGSTWTEQVLFNFSGGSTSTTGFFPIGPIVQDAAGNIYGTTTMSGDANNSDGLVYELTPSSSGWNETVIYSFSAASEGATPQSGLIIDSAGNLYGTTLSGDKGIGFGNVFELSPSSSGWVYSVLHKFTGAPDGESPGGLVLDAAGNLYGPAGGGGTYRSGLAYEIIP